MASEISFNTTVGDHIRVFQSISFVWSSDRSIIIRFVCSSESVNCQIEIEILPGIQTAFSSGTLLRYLPTTSPGALLWISSRVHSCVLAVFLGITTDILFHFLEFIMSSFMCYSRNFSENFSRIIFRNLRWFPTGILLAYICWLSRSRDFFWCGFSRSSSTDSCRYSSMDSFGICSKYFSKISFSFWWLGLGFFPGLPLQIFFRNSSVHEFLHEWVL